MTTGIAHKGIKREANYILAVKQNEKKLYQDIEDGFRFGQKIETDLFEDLDHGGIETSKCSDITNFKFIE